MSRQSGVVMGVGFAVSGVRYVGAMAFAQPSGPLASARRIDELAQLLNEHGYGTFREARHRLGLSQRQSNGKFTEAEVAATIELIESGGGEDGEAFSAPTSRKGKATPAEALVGSMPDQMLADELARRGWCVIAPSKD